MPKEKPETRSHLKERLLKTNLYDFSIKISWAEEERTLHLALSKEYGIIIRPDKHMEATVFGDPRKIKEFLTSVHYGMSHADISREFPELENAPSASPIMGLKIEDQVNTMSKEERTAAVKKLSDPDQIQTLE